MASGKCGPGWRPLGGGGGKAAVGCGRIPPDVLVAVRVFDPDAESVSKRTTAKTIDTSAAAIVINHADQRLICAILRGHDKGAAEFFAAAITRGGQLRSFAWFERESVGEDGRLIPGLNEFVVYRLPSVYNSDLTGQAAVATVKGLIFRPERIFAVDSLVSVQWLAEHLEDPQLRVFDATLQVRRLLLVPIVRTGKREWRREHIPGSAFVSLFELSDPAKPRRTLTMPSAEWFSERIGALGVSNRSRVVVYDRRENMWAARLWWMLRVFGFDDAAILDGGWTAWKQAGYPVCSAPCHYPPTTFQATMRPEMVVGKQQVLAVIDDPDVCLINALGRRQHRGEVNEYGRRGHIPGSRNVTAWEILDRHTQCYRPLPELRVKVGTALDAERIITYCGAGAAAASLANVLVRLGHPDVAIYDGGLLEWCADRKLPLETGL